MAIGNDLSRQTARDSPPTDLELFAERFAQNALLVFHLTFDISFLRLHQSLVAFGALFALV